MNSLSRTLFLIALAGASLELVADPARIDSSNAFDYPEFWPRFIHTSEPIARADGEVLIKEGTRGVLIRMEDEQTLLVDFGSDGHHRLSFEQTDFLALANAILRGEERKADGNLVAMMLPRLADPSGEYLMPFAYEKGQNKQAFLILYMPTDDSGAFFRELGPVLAPRLETFERRQTLPFIITTERTGNVAIGNVLAYYEIRVPFVQEHLQEPYVNALQHHPEPGIPLAVLVDPNGKILHRANLTGDWDQVFDEIVELLPPDPDVGVGTVLQSGPDTE